MEWKRMKQGELLYRFPQVAKNFTFLKLSDSLIALAFTVMLLSSRLFYVESIL